MLMVCEEEPPELLAHTVYIVRVMLMSGVAREGVTDVLRALRNQIDDDRLRHRPAQEADPWHP